MDTGGAQDANRILDNITSLKEVDVTTADHETKSDDTSESGQTPESGQAQAESKSSPTNDNAGRISPQDMLLAATLVRDAMAGRNMFFKTDEDSIHSYVLFNHIVFKIALFVCMLGNLALAVFEHPGVIKGTPYWATMIFEGIFLIYFIVRLFHNMRFSPRMKFIRDPKNIVVFGLVVITFIDIICYCIWINIAPPAVAQYAVRWSRPLRPLFLVNFPEGAQIRKAFRNIRKTLPDIVHVLILFLCSIALFALMGMKLFQKRGLLYPDGRKYFDNYFESFWDLYVLVTTANNPDAMMPAYDSSRWWSIFFVIFLVINLYIFMSIVLAVIYNNYKNHLKNEVRATVYLKRRLLSRAFDLLRVRGVGRYILPRARWHELLAVIDPKKSRVHRELLLCVLDDRGDYNIDKPAFLKLADLLNVGVAEVTDKTLFIETICPALYHSKASQLLKQVVRHRFFRLFFDFAILVNAFCIGFSVEQVEWFFLAIFIVEIVLKMYTFGPLKFFKNLWNAFDFVVIFGALITTVVETILEENEARERTLDFILVLRCLRLVRLAGSIERFQIVITTIVNIAPSILTYGGVIFVVYYMFAIIGMEAFQGKIRYFGYDDLDPSTKFCGNPKLNGSEFYTKRYCNNNFNDIANAFVLLFELMVVNQWHVLTQGFVLVTHVAARIYFISFHMICVVILLNIFTAFVLEVFMLEYNVSQGELETAIETKIKEMGLGEGQQAKISIGEAKPDTADLVENMEQANDASQASDASTSTTVTTDQNSNRPSPVVTQDTGLRFKLKKNANKSVGVILQHMFEGEIDPNDEGPEDLDVLEYQRRTRRMTLDNSA